MHPRATIILLPLLLAAHVTAGRELGGQRKLLDHSASGSGVCPDGYHCCGREKNGQCTEACKQAGLACPQQGHPTHIHMRKLSEQADARPAEERAARLEDVPALSAKEAAVPLKDAPTLSAQQKAALIVLQQKVQALQELVATYAAEDALAVGKSRRELAANVKEEGGEVAEDGDDTKLLKKHCGKGGCPTPNPFYPGK